MRDDPAALHRRRLRTAWVIVVLSVVVGVAAAAAVALIGGTGAAGMAVLLLCAGVGFALAGVVVLVRAVVDEFRDLPVEGRRIGLGIGFLGGAIILVVMSMGAAGG